MASSRKLQGEIDRVLKQIGEHMQEFDQIWQKVHSAPTPNLKEKYEGDLKKEIKKLQRFRDQIKSWAANSDIKNKKPLLDARKSIETEMERFKVLEKETKTKAYSKEGLSSGAGGRRGGRMRSGSSSSAQVDPREDPAKRETFAWLDRLEESLSEQVEAFEEKLEGVKASSKKKKSSALDQQVDEIQARIDRHQFHIDSIQTIKDRLEHDELAVALVEDIHDDLDYYLNSHADVDFQEDETMYDALELDKDTERNDEQEDDGEAAEEADEQEAEGQDEADEEETEEAQEEEDEEEDEGVQAGTVSAILKGAGAKPTPTKGKQAQSAAAAAKTNAASKATPATSAPSAASVVKGRSTPASSPAAAAGPAPVVPPASASGKQDTLASIVSKQQRQAAAAAAAATAATTPAPAPAAAATADNKRGTSGKAAPTAATTAAIAEDAKKAAAKAAPTTAATPTATPMTKTTAPGVIPSIAPAQLGRMPPGSKPPGTHAAPSAQSMMPPPGLTSQTPPPGLGLGTQVGGAPGPSAGASAGVGAASGSDPSMALPAGQSAHVKDRSLVPDDYSLQLALLEPSLRHLPSPIDSDRPRVYLPRNPYRTPAYFPSVPAPIFDDQLLFEQLSVDTLFFIFYFQQGTPHQYLAARELKKQSWRYHKNFLTWFQRHDDPKLTTDDFEQGTYVYFDYESGWTQRIKADFTFEYRHLEDELQVPIANNM